MKARLLATSAMGFACASLLFLQPGLAQTSPSASPHTTPPAASTAGKPGEARKTTPDMQAIMKFSQPGNTAIRDIGNARLAIFNGAPDKAVQLVTEAKADVAKAEQEAPSFAAKTTTTGEGNTGASTPQAEKVEMVPVDGQLVTSEDFVASPEKSAHVAKANEHLRSGRYKEGLEELRLGEIEVRYNRVWMPLASTEKHLEQAIKLMNEHKYYEANLALKAIDDSLVVDSVAVTELPKNAEAPKKTG
jgi:YfdX protein